MSDKKPREFWIEFGGDPSDDKEVYKRYSATVPFEPASYAEEVFHCIEYSAYQNVTAELAKRNIELADVTRDLKYKLDQAEATAEYYKCKLAQKADK